MRSNPTAFSTLACPDWDVFQILHAAQTYGYNAVELRGYQKEMDLPRADPFTPQNAHETRKRFEDTGIAVCCVSSSGVIAQANVEHVRAHAALAQSLGCPFVRIFGGNLPTDIPREDALNAFAQTLRTFGDAAQSEGVSIVLETHDAFSTGESVADLLTRTAHLSVFALWDLHHPHRQGEAWPETMRLLLPFLRYVHAKDGTPAGYTLPGQGDVPLTAMLGALTEAGYEGPVSVEWEKRWHPDLPTPDVALPAYSDFLHQVLRK